MRNMHLSRHKCQGSVKKCKRHVSEGDRIGMCHILAFRINEEGEAQIPRQVLILRRNDRIGVTLSDGVSRHFVKT